MAKQETKKAAPKKKIDTIETPIEIVNKNATVNSVKYTRLENGNYSDGKNEVKFKVKK